jgi:hypothetical protein
VGQPDRTVPMEAVTIGSAVPELHDHVSQLRLARSDPGTDIDNTCDSAHGLDHIDHGGWLHAATTEEID